LFKRNWSYFLDQAERFPPRLYPSERDF